MGNNFYLFNMQLQSHWYFPCISILCKFSYTYWIEDKQKEYWWYICFEFISSFTEKRYKQEFDLILSNMIRCFISYLWTQYKFMDPIPIFMRLSSKIYSGHPLGYCFHWHTQLKNYKTFKVLRKYSLEIRISHPPAVLHYSNKNLKAFT